MAITYPLINTVREDAARAPRKGFWLRLFEAIQESQTRRAELELAKYMALRRPSRDDDAGTGIWRAFGSRRAF